MSNQDGFIEKVLRNFAETITDQVFLTIEKDRDLMKEYLDLVDSSSLNAVNTELGKAVKNRFNLGNKDERENKPESVLIQSYEKHCFK